MSNDSEKGRYASPDGSATWEVIATMSCALLIFCVGCIPGWNSPTLGILRAPGTPIPLTPSDASTLTAMIALGHSLAPALIMVMANKLGRKNSILVAGIPTIVSWALISVTNDLTVLLVARFIGGLSLGLMFCLPQMYLGEIASAKFRGAISMMCGTMLNTGILFMFVVVPYLSIHSMARLSATIVTVAVLSVWFIPESPYFLATVGKIEEAEIALEKLRGKTDVSEELDLIKTTISQKGKGPKGRNEEEGQAVVEKSSAWKQLFSVPGNRKALAINFLFPVVLYCGSCVPIVAYAQIIFEKMQTGVSPHFCTMVIASLQIICNILTAIVIDKLGRKPLLCVSGIVSGICLVVVSSYFYLMEYTKTDVTPYATIALFAVFINLVALNIGWMPLQHVIQSEILASDVKEVATCVIGIGGGVIATIGIKVYLMMAETWGLGHSVPFFGFVFVTWISTALILKLLPETKGKTLLDIQRDLNSR